MALASMLGMVNANTASQKNLSLSPAVSDLGLGDNLTQQLQNKLEEERKKKQGQMTPDAQQNGMVMNPAVLSIFGTGTGNG